MKKKIYYLLFIVFLIFSGWLLAQPNPTRFPLPGPLEPNVRFWISIFTRYSASQYIFFDTRNVDRIYTVLDLKKYFPDGEPTPKKKDAILNAQKDSVVLALKNLGDQSNYDRIFSKEELELASLFGDSAKPEDFQKAAECIRIQHGCREQFLEGLIRSGKYLDSLKILFIRNGLPEELIYLPHVESSFNPLAGSKAGAVGMWQFISSTGKKFLHIDDCIDERRDPYLSAAAAVRLLKLSYDSLKSWPLAITAYNHGLLGIKKVVKELDTKDLGEMVTRFESKQFGFASKNFYAEFIAAVCVAQNPFRYFDTFTMYKSWKFKTVELPLDMDVHSIKNAFHMSDSVFAELNPSLSKSVLMGKKKIPVHFLLHFPVDMDERVGFEAWVSEGLLPRGAYLAWCSGMERILFQYVEKTPLFFSTKKDKRG